jgi:type II secretory pathway pseudopilin PulG
MGEKGFTLLEIILVLFFMALILGLSAINFVNRLPSVKLNATTREFAATIKHAWSIAKISNERQVVTIDLDSKTYGIDGLSEKNIPPDISVIIADSLSGEICHGKYRLVFQAVGGTECSRIVLWEGKRKQSIQMDPIIGAIVVKQ